MQVLREDQGLDIHVRGFRFLSIRLKSRPETEALVAGVDAVREKLRADNDAYEDAVEQRVAASAEIEYLDSKLDEQVMGFARHLNALIGGNREDPRYKKLFPISPTTMMKPVGGDEQAMYVEGILDRVTQEPEYASLKEHAKPIRAKLEQLNKATKARKELYVAEAKAQANRRASMDEARRVYRLMHPRLTLLFPDDQALVESFFAAFTKGARGDVETPPVVDGPAPA